MPLLAPVTGTSRATMACAGGFLATPTVAERRTGRRRRLAGDAIADRASCALPPLGAGQIADTFMPVIRRKHGGGGARRKAADIRIYGVIMAAKQNSHSTFGLSRRSVNGPPAANAPAAILHGWDRPSSSEGR